MIRRLRSKLRAWLRPSLTPHQRAAITRKRNWLAKSAAHRAELRASIPALQTEAGQ